MNELHLLRPWWLLALVPLLLLAWHWWRRQRGSSAVASSIDSELLDVLLEPRDGRPGQPQGLAMAGGLILCVLALAGPAWERLPQPVERDADGLVIIFDLSLSMYVEDVQPSRLVRAQQKITDLLRLREQGFTGLVAYAGDAHTVTPLTDDTGTIINLLASLAPAMMPVLGSDPAAALRLARDLLTNAGFNQGRLVLVTDGIDQPAALLRDCSRHYPLSILGVGSATGGTIPLAFAKQPGRVLRTQQGEVITPKLDERRLTEVAEACYGRYRQATIGDEDVRALMRTRLPGSSETQETNRRFDRWTDRGYLLLLLLLPLLLCGFRRGVLVSAPAGLVLALWLTFALHANRAEAADTAMTEQAQQAPQASAGEAAASRTLEQPGPLTRAWRSLWQRPDQRAHERLLEGAPAVAATLFEDPEWRAVADYRAGNYAEAAAAYAKQPSLTGRYNYATSLARLGELDAAIAAYERVLADDPAHADARFNKEQLERLKEQQQQQAQQQQDGEQQDGEQQDHQDSDSSPGGGNTQDEQPAPPDPGADTPEQSAQQEAQDQKQADADNATADASDTLADQRRDEDTEALEQWLRRIPDDPGGLLRRKFQYETNERLRSGELERRERKQIW